MSDYERNTGKLYPKTEQEVKESLENIEGFDDYDNLEEAAMELHYYVEDVEQYLLLNGNWYLLVDHKQPNPYVSYCDITEHEDFIEFSSYHYNGGAHFTELIEEAISQ